MERTRCLMVLVFVLVFGLTAGIANAAVMAVDEFDYPADADLIGLDGGAGWNMPWKEDTQEPMTGSASIDDDMLGGSYPSLEHPTIIMPAPVGNHVLTGAINEVRIGRRASTTVPDVDGNVAWVSYLFRVETTPILMTGTLPGNERGLHLQGGATFWGGHIIGTGQPWKTDSFGLLTADPWTGWNSGDTITKEVVYWIVVKMEMKGLGNDDPVYLWVDPDPGPEPETANANVATVEPPGWAYTVPADKGDAKSHARAGEFNRVAIIAFEQGRFDRIRLATTWIDCVGFSPSLASNPRPIDDEINVDPNILLLEWDPPTEVPCTPTYDVYFGTDPTMATNPKILDDSTATSVDPSPGVALAIDTDYYWRVDVNDPNCDGGCGNCVPFVREGAVWHFTTWPYTPLILTQPEDTLVPPGGNGQFTVVSGGNLAGSHTYQWYHYVNPGDANQVLSDGARFSGTTTDSLTVLDCQFNADPLLDDEGFYWCRVTNTFGSTNSDSAGLVILRLLARYRFHANAQDSVSNYDATKVGTAGYVGGGIEGFAISLDGSTGYLYVPYIIGESVGTFEKFTIAAWVNPDVSEGDGVIWAGYDDTAGGPPTDGGGLSIERLSDGTALVRVKGNTPDEINVGPNAIPQDQWTYVAFVYDSNSVVGTGTLYINGEQAGQVEYDTAKAQQIGPFSMGAYKPDGGLPTRFFDGQLDDVRIYAYPITAVNVASLYNEMTLDPVCVRPESPEPADLNGDCHADMLDIKIMAETWLVSNIVP